MTFLKEELQRYNRQIILPEIGEEGQKKLKSAKVLLVGTGGLGSPIAMYLAAAGVGNIGIVDFDKVDVSNLHRQVVHRESSVERNKVDSAAEAMNDINPHVNIVKHNIRIDSSNAIDIISKYDIVVDGCDNFPTRYLINDACVMLGKPNVYGSIFKFEGQATIFASNDGPCLRCMFPEPPTPGDMPSCSEIGVLGILPGNIGLIQATEVIKLIVGIGKPLIGRYLLYSALDMSYNELSITKNPECPVCGESPSIKELIDYEEFCGIKNNMKTMDSKENWENGSNITPGQFKAALDNSEDLFVLDVREEYELKICNLPMAINIPMQDVESDLEKIPKDKKVVVICHHGARSRAITNLLQTHRYEYVYNLTGGLDRYALEIDNNMERY